MRVVLNALFVWSGLVATAAVKVTGGARFLPVDEAMAVAAEAYYNEASELDSCIQGSDTNPARYTADDCEALTLYRQSALLGYAAAGELGFTGRRAPSHATPPANAPFHFGIIPFAPPRYRSRPVNAST